MSTPELAAYIEFAVVMTVAPPSTTIVPLASESPCTDSPAPVDTLVMACMPPSNFTVPPWMAK